MAGLLDAIINPSQANIPGAFEKGQVIREAGLERQDVARGREAKDIAGELLGATQTGQLGALLTLDPEIGMAIMEHQGIPSTSTGRQDKFKGTIVFANQIAQGGDKAGALAIIDDYIVSVQGATGGQELAQNAQRFADRMRQGDPNTFVELNQLATAFTANQQGPSALDQAKTAETAAKTKKLGVETELLDKSNPTDQLKIQELQLKIENQQAVVEDRKQKAIAASSQRDSTAVAGAFEAQGAIANIDDLLLDDAFEDIYGVGDKFIPTIFSGAVALEAKRDQIVALLGLESRQKLKGQGTISDSEARSLADSATLLGNPGIDEVTAKKELKKVRRIFQRAQDRAMKNPEAKLQIGIAAKKARLEELREKATQ